MSVRKPKNGISFGYKFDESIDSSKPGPSDYILDNQKVVTPQFTFSKEKRFKELLSNGGEINGVMYEKKLNHNLPTSTSKSDKSYNPSVIKSTFGKTNRKVYGLKFIESNVGPGKYNIIDEVNNKKKGITISGRWKEKASANFGPGPGQYSIDQNNSKDFSVHNIPRDSPNNRSNHQKENEGIGPGVYNPKMVESKIVYSFPKSKKELENEKEIVDCLYSPKFEKTKITYDYSIPTSKRMANSTEIVPGPCYYDVKYSQLLNKQGGYIEKAKIGKTLESSNLGPGSYNVNFQNSQVRSHAFSKIQRKVFNPKNVAVVSSFLSILPKKSAPLISFTKDKRKNEFLEIKKDKIPCPSSYNIRIPTETTSKVTMTLSNRKDIFVLNSNPGPADYSNDYLTNRNIKSKNFAFKRSRYSQELEKVHMDIDFSEFD